VAEEPTRDAVELASNREAIELSESRKGTHLQSEMGLPAGFDPPSAALAPSPAEPATAPPPSGQSETIQAADAKR
jgi:hypothetical protein